MPTGDVVSDINKLYSGGLNLLECAVDRAAKERRWHVVAQFGAKALKNLDNILPQHLMADMYIFEGIIKRFPCKFFSSVKVADTPEIIFGWDVADELCLEWERGHTKNNRQAWSD